MTDTMRDRFVKVTSALLDEESRLVVVLAEIGVLLFAADGAIKRHPGRVVNVGIREQLMVSVGAGLAREGLRPVVHSYAPFLVERPFEQVKLDFGHQGVGGIFVSVGASYDSASSGRTHQAPEDVALMATLPGWRIEVPGHPDELEHILRAAAKTDDSFYIRTSNDMNARPVGLDDGRMTVIRQDGRGAPVVIAVGPMLDRVSEAIADMDVTLLYAVTVRPFDAETLHAAAGSEIVIVEPYQAGTSSAEITTALRDRPCRLLSLGVPNSEFRHYGSSTEHDAAHGLDSEGIRRSIEEFLRVKAPSM